MHMQLFSNYMQLLASKTAQEMRDRLDCDELDFRFEIGVSEPSNKLMLSDLCRIVEAIATHCTVVKFKAQIDQIIDGLKTLGVYDLINPPSPTLFKTVLLKGHF